MSVTSLHHAEWRNLLCTNLMSLYKKAALCDTKLRMSDSDCILPAHGCVLTAASPVLMSQLERDNGDLCLPPDLNYPCHIWECLLQFIYSGTVTLASTSQAAEVLEAAETLELHMLVYLCEYYMKHVGSAVVETATNPPHTDWESGGNIDTTTVEAGYDSIYDSIGQASESVTGTSKHKRVGSRLANVISKCSITSSSQSADKREGNTSKTLLSDHDQSLTLHNKREVAKRTEEKSTFAMRDDQCMGSRSNGEETSLKSSVEVTGGQGHTDMNSQQSVDVNSVINAQQAGACLKVAISKEASSPPTSTSFQLSTSCQPSTREQGSVVAVSRRRQGQVNGRTTKPPLVCPQCGKLFAHPSVLLIHSRKHTGEKPFVCIVCGQTFSQSSALKGHHQRVHSSRRPYECVTCGKTFTHKSDVQVHQRVHTNERPYTCSECGKSFARQTDLACHRRCHLVDKMFTCGTCGRGFSQRCALRCHKRVHTGDRPYVCRVCSRAFSSARALNKHAGKHDV